MEGLWATSSLAVLGLQHAHAPTSRERGLFLRLEAEGLKDHTREELAEGVAKG